MADWIIRGARVIDPAAGTDDIRDIYIKGTRIMEPDFLDGECLEDRIIDARGMVVTPGLIDYHAHVFHTGSTISIDPDMLLSQGTTTVVDAGTAGWAGFGSFEESVIKNSEIRIKAFMNVYASGQADALLPENYDPVLYDRNRMLSVIDEYRDDILGLKIRLSNGIVPPGSALEYLEACVDLADELESLSGLHLRVCVHTTDSPIPQVELSSCLRPGDIFCHCYQGEGNTILDMNGNVSQGILRARERGIIFDAANGRGNFSLKVAKQAISNGFLPDIISSDLTAFTFQVPPYVKSLPCVMSKYLALGLDLTEIVRRCTEAPAEIMGMSGEIGTLRAGAIADIAVFSLEDHSWDQMDFSGDKIACDQLLVPHMTFRAGNLKYCSNDMLL